MAVWIPVLKAALPYVSNLVATALPVFTSKKEQEASAELVARQIAELQTAVTGNAEAVKGLAAQLEKTITALEAGESDLSRRFAGLQGDGQEHRRLTLGGLGGHHYGDQTSPYFMSLCWARA